MSGKVWAIVIVVILLALIGSCGGESEYERAGNEFSSWVNTDPNGWTDTQKDYFINFMEWSDNH